MELSNILKKSSLTLSTFFTTTSGRTDTTTLSKISSQTLAQKLQIFEEKLEKTISINTTATAQKRHIYSLKMFILNVSIFTL